METPQTNQQQLQTDIENTFRLLVPYSLGGDATMTSMDVPLRWHEQRWAHEHDQGPRELSVCARMGPRSARHLDLTRVMRGDPDRPSTDSHLWRFHFEEPRTPQDAPEVSKVSTDITVTKTGEVMARRSTYEGAVGDPLMVGAEYNDEITEERRQELCGYASNVLVEAGVVLPDMQEAFMETLPRYYQKPVGVDFAAHASAESVAAIYEL